jgi:hypothetical protein
MLKKLNMDTNPEFAVNKDEILKLAEQYMKNRKVDVVLPGEVGEIIGDKVEVVFLDPIALEPNVIVCPPDNRVWVNIKTKEVTWIDQM